MNRINTKGLLLLFSLLGTFILVPIELGIILSASKKEYGAYLLKSAFACQEKAAVWKMSIIAFIFLGIAGILSASIALIENYILAEIRASVLYHLPAGFDWALEPDGFVLTSTNTHITM